MDKRRSEAAEIFAVRQFPKVAGIYLLIVSNENTIIMCEICLAIKALSQCVKSV